MKVHLILDQQSVTAHDGVRFALNPAAKHPDNPVMLPGEPHQWDSLQISWPATVLYSADERKFRCWYSGFDVIQTPDRFWKPGYAESDDGVHWVKPNLGQAEFMGADTNRLEPDWDYGILSTVFENPTPGAPESKRWASLWCELGERMSFLRKGLAYSPDGISWTRELTAYEGVPFDRASFQDISQVIYDPDEADPDLRTKAYSQLVWTRAHDGREGVRHIGLAHGPSIESLAGAPDPVALAPEEGIDEELHFAAVSKVGGQFLMLFESDRFANNPIHGDLKLAASADGRKFRRVHPHTALVGTGPKGFWDENLLVTTTSAMQEVGDQVYIFYIGCPNIYNSWPPPYMVSPERRGSMFAPAYLGLATLPRDRYAYAEGPGSVTIQSPAAGGLWVNADGDEVMLAALDSSGKTLSEGHVTGEIVRGVYRKVAWSAQGPAAAATIRVTLGKGCRLYSLGFEE